tara:strand:- start:11796 stop:12206 length:411 start_codon:yes stop_codon:yes gene_type:complete
MSLEKLVIHSTETPFGVEVDMEIIEAEHLEKGFETIGFCDIINFDGIIESTARLYNFHEGEKPHNWGIPNSRHIAYLGGISEDGFNIEDTRTLEQQEALEVYIEFMKRRHPGLKIIDDTRTSIVKTLSLEEQNQTQ